MPACRNYDICGGMAAIEYGLCLSCARRTVEPAASRAPVFWDEPPPSPLKSTVPDADRVRKTTVVVEEEKVSHDRKDGSEKKIDRDEKVVKKDEEEKSVSDDRLCLPAQSAVANVCSACQRGTKANGATMSADELYDYLFQLAGANNPRELKWTTSRNDGMSCLCIPCKALPATVRMFVKTAHVCAADEKQPTMVFSLHPFFGLMHTPHWDLCSSLPWDPLSKKRSALGEAVGKALAAANDVESNVNKALNGGNKLPPHVQELRKQGAFPATMEYALPQLGPEARLVLTYDASTCTKRPVAAFITSHYQIPNKYRSIPNAHPNPFFFIDNIAEEEIDVQKSCCVWGQKVRALGNECILTIAPSEIEAKMTPAELGALLPQFYKGPPKATEMKHLCQCDDAVFDAPRIRKILPRPTFRDWFAQLDPSLEVKQAGFPICEVTQSLERSNVVLPDDAPEFHISVREANGPDKYYDMHLTLRPSFRINARDLTSVVGSDRLATEQVGGATSYFFYRFYVDTVSKKLVIYPKCDPKTKATASFATAESKSKSKGQQKAISQPSAPSEPIGGHRLFLLVVSRWLDRRPKQKAVFNGLARLEPVLKDLNDAITAEMWAKLVSALKKV